MAARGAGAAGAKRNYYQPNAYQMQSRCWKDSNWDSGRARRIDFIAEAAEPLDAIIRAVSFAPTAERRPRTL
jgi:hypothetical protein